mmetsp:Transcript_11911/g.30397  ORF Transcript_11911/g.30397 Transcript_11911/m.30397 type:complete len:222 (-) Transcript_11911:386-1051(-)
MRRRLAMSPRSVTKQKQRLRLPNPLWEEEIHHQADGVCRNVHLEKPGLTGKHLTHGAPTVRNHIRHTDGAICPHGQQWAFTQAMVVASSSAGPRARSRAAFVTPPIRDVLNLEALRTREIVQRRRQTSSCRYKTHKQGRRTEVRSSWCCHHARVECQSLPTVPIFHQQVIVGHREHEALENKHDFTITRWVDKPGAVHGKNVKHIRPAAIGECAARLCQSL